MKFPTVQEVEKADPSQLKKWFRLLRPMALSYTQTKKYDSVFLKVCELCEQMGLFTDDFQEKGREATAIHEAAHAVILISLGLQVQEVEIHNWLSGVTKFSEPLTIDEKRKIFVAVLAAQWAEFRFAPESFVWAGSISDDQRIAELMKERGDCQNLYEHLGDQTLDEVDANEDKIRRVAQELLRTGKLTGEQVRTLCQEKSSK